MRLALELSGGRLKFDPVNGRRVWYLSITFLVWTVWFQWWDTDRAWGKDGHLDLFRSWDRLMCATAGVRTAPRYRS